MKKALSRVSAFPAPDRMRGRPVKKTPLVEPSRYSPEYYESVKDTYPVLYIQDPDFDGDAYTFSSMEDGEPWTAAYRYLVRYEEDTPPQASYDRLTAWMLLNDASVVQDETMTYRRTFESWTSAVLENHIDSKTVYQDYV